MQLSIRQYTAFVKSKMQILNRESAISVPDTVISFRFEWIALC